MDTKKETKEEFKPAKKGQFKMRKQTTDRRLRAKADDYHENMYLKMEGKEVP